MQFDQKFNLPDGEVPTGIFSVVITQSGQIFLVHPVEATMICVISAFGAGIQAATSAASEKEKMEREQSRIVRPILASVPRDIRDR